MSELTAEELAAWTAATDQDKATVRDLTALVRRHWADDSGCKIPKCPGRTVMAPLLHSDPGTVINLLLAALVLLAEQQEQEHAKHTPGWAVIDAQHRRHDFTGPEKAMGYAIDQAWTDKATELESPEGERWVVLRRHADVVVVAARKIGIVR